MKKIQELINITYWKELDSYCESLCDEKKEVKFEPNPSGSINYFIIVYKLINLKDFKGGTAIRKMTLDKFKEKLQEDLENIKPALLYWSCLFLDNMEDILNSQSDPLEKDKLKDAFMSYKLYFESITNLEILFKMAKHRHETKFIPLRKSQFTTIEYLSLIEENYQLCKKFSKD